MTFNWQQFHKNLDGALATWITEDQKASIHSPLIDFLKYSHGKSQGQGKEVKLDQPYDPETNPNGYDFDSEEGL